MPIDRDAADRLLCTTRSVKRRLDITRPVPRSLILECIDIAMQAPSAGNRQQAGFVVVDDPAKRAALADLYRQSHSGYQTTPAANYSPGDPRASSASGVASAGAQLVDILADVPVHVIPVIEGRPEGRPPGALAALYGSVLPMGRGRSRSPHAPAVSARRGPRCTCAASAKRRSSWAYRTPTARWRCCPSRSTRATTSRPRRDWARER